MPHKDLEERRKYHREYYKKNKASLDAYRRDFRDAHPLLEKEWQAVYLGRSKEKRKFYSMKSRYGLTEEEYNQMILQQDNKCAVCTQPFTTTPHVDHCHTTGRVRGLLCSPCNTGLGVYEKKAYLFAEYLKITEKETNE